MYWTKIKKERNIFELLYNAQVKLEINIRLNRFFLLSSDYTHLKFNHKIKIAHYTE